MSENPQKKERNIKDLSIKLQILTSALVAEREKTANYVAKIKEFEQMIIKKETEITNANKAKFDMQSELSTLTKKQKKDKTDVKLDQVVNTFFNKDKINFNQFDNIKEENNAVKQEYKKYQRKFIEEHELREQQQMKFDTMIALQDQDIKNAQERINRLENEKKEQERNNKLLNDIILGLDDEKQKYEKEYKDIENLINKNDKTVTVIMMDNAKCTGDLKPKLDKIKNMTKQYTEQKSTLSEMKNQISHVVLETIDFNAIKEENIFKKEKVVITFRPNELDQKYKIEIDYENNDKQPKEIFDFLDVSDYKIKSKTNFECSIADKNLKIKKIVLDFDPLLIDFFAQRFSEFYNKSREIV